MVWFVGQYVLIDDVRSPEPGEEEQGKSGNLITSWQSSTACWTLSSFEFSFSAKSYFSSFPFFGLGQIAVMVERYSLPDSVQISKNLIYFSRSLFWKPV